MEQLKPRKSGKVKVDDVNLYYEIYGKGDPLVFVAGTDASGRALYQLAMVEDISERKRAETRAGPEAFGNVHGVDAPNLQRAGAGHCLVGPEPARGGEFDDGDEAPGRLDLGCGG